MKIILNQRNSVRLRFFGYNKDNVPIISDSGIDNLAEQILRKYDNNIYKLGYPLKPIDVDKLIEIICNKKLLYYKLSNNGSIFGMTARIDGKIDVITDDADKKYLYLKKGDICIDETACNSEHRIRFTLAHELCHSLIHAGISVIDTNTNFIDNNTTFSAGKITTPSGWMEHHANIFAASILMPKKLVMRLWKKFLKKNKFSTDELKTLFVTEIVNIFNVSPEAASIRLKKLKIL